ncbi:MAG: hypothetical protein IPH75_02265 [bacterium]|nr:hypothetical protein [bacterium]
MEDRAQHRFDILRQLAIAGYRGEDFRPTAEMALRQAADLVGLQAAALYLWNDSRAITLAVSHADSIQAQETLTSLEESLFAGLRKDRQLLAAYMSFGGNPPFQTFTLPIRFGESMLGAVIGIQEGDHRLVSEDMFLEAVCAALSLYVVAGQAGLAKAATNDLIAKERLGAVLQTAVTVNHEINNPLTAILGNIQLLLMKRKDLDEELVSKLKTVEEAALKIKDVTQRLLRITSARSVDYAEGTSMLDISDDPDSK